MLIPFFVKEWLLDIFYPPTCITCEQDGAWLCEGCLERIPLFDVLDDEIVSIGPYANPVLRSLLTQLKYCSAYCLASALRELAARFAFAQRGLWPWIDEPTLSICAIPSDARRIRERGFDHIKILLDIVHAEIVPQAILIEGLVRSKHVVQNASLPANILRQQNIQGVFKALNPVQGAVLLVDDIYTTGATWHEAARVLQEAGASKVYGFVFARKHEKKI